MLRDVHHTDAVLDLGAWLGHTPPTVPIQVRLGVEQRNRWSWMPPLVEKRWDRRVSLGLGARF